MIKEHWPSEICHELNQPYMQKLFTFLNEERRQGKKIYPEETDVFEAFNQTPFENIKVVILGQDPYHGPGLAHGLSFSVPLNQTIPPSLVNINKELESDLGIPRPNHGHLLSWAKQGVFLLNNVLTVEEAKPGSHHNKGWEQFTDKVIQVLSKREKPMAFLLWGLPAQKKAVIVNNKRHFVLKSPHPSPLSAYRGFFGSRPFSQTNEWLKRQGWPEINWQLPDKEKAT